ncbi:MAG: uroporphyrinogen decarboxylase family protein, partial [Spirochaetota bacterium]
RFPVMTWMSSFAQKKYIAHYGVSPDELWNLQNPNGSFQMPSCKYTGETKKPDSEAGWYDEFGVGWKSEPGDIGAINTAAPIKNIEDIKKYQFPDVQTEYSFDEAVSQIAKLNGSSFLAANQASGTFFNKYRFLRGFEDGLVDMMINQNEVEYLLDQLLEYQLALARKYIACGVNAVNTGDDVALQKGLVINPDVWRKLIKPRQKILNDLYKSAGLYVIHHCCGDCRSIIKDYIETGVDCLNPIQPETMPIEDLADEFGSDLTFYGGVGVQGVMQNGTPKDVDNAVKITIRTLGAHGRYIIGASHTIQDCIPVENVHAYFEAVEKYNQ